MSDQRLFWTSTVITFAVVLAIVVGARLLAEVIR